MTNRFATAFVLVLLAGLVLVACGPLAELGPLGDAGDAFMTALKNGDWAGSYAMLSAGTQRDLATAEEWAAGWAQAERPVSWAFNSRSIENDTGRLEGTVDWDTGQKSECILLLVREGGSWKIDGYSFSLIE